MEYAEISPSFAFRVFRVFRGWFLLFLFRLCLLPLCVNRSGLDLRPSPLPPSQPLFHRRIHFDQRWPGTLVALARKFAGGIDP